jgi:hypothetical protein
MSGHPDDPEDNSNGDDFTYDASAAATPFVCDYCKAGFPTSADMELGFPFQIRQYRLTNFILATTEAPI